MSAQLPSAGTPVRQAHYERWPLSWWQDVPLGRLVTRVEMSNGYGVLPAGTPVRIEDKRNGFAIRMAACPTCDVALRINRVAPSNLVWS